MSRRAAPSMPTQRQIHDALKAVTILHPGARIARVGPEGVTFEYPEGRRQSDTWQNKPFTAEGA